MSENSHPGMITSHAQAHPEKDCTAVCVSREFGFGLNNLVG